MSSLPVVMKADLQLCLRPIIRDLPHETQLYLEVFPEGVAKGSIGSVPVEELHTPTVSDVSLSVDEQFIV